MIVATHGILANAVPSNPLFNGLYAAYNFDNNANDSFGSNNGTPFGGISYGTTSGLINTSVGFNGANAYINLPNNTGQFNFSDDFSVSLWVKPANTTGYIILMADYLNSGINNYGYLLDLTGGTTRFLIFDGTNQGGIVINQLPISNVWNHIVITRKKSTITKMYYNGVLKTPSSTTNPTLNPTYQPTMVPSFGAWLGNYKYTGWMDAVNFWTKELTATEVTTLYNSSNGIQYPF
jgi:hypothetical protein